MDSECQGLIEFTLSGFIKQEPVSRRERAR